jgi:tRNA(fMet)-specific endonuclease VapC
MAQRRRTAKLQFLLDTDTCIYLLNDVASVKENVRQAGLQSLGISIITLAELFFGAYHSQKVEHNLGRVREFISPPSLRLLPVTQAIVEKFGSLKADLAKRGQLIGDFDIVIASTALIHQCSLVTNNQKHYLRIKNLSLENGARPDLGKADLAASDVHAESRPSASVNLGRAGGEERPRPGAFSFAFFHNSARI